MTHLDPACVRAARLIDLNVPTPPPLPRAVAVDANVLYWIFYPSFAGLAGAGDAPPVYQTKIYPGAFNRGLRNGTRFVTSLGTLLELVHQVEEAELRIATATSGERGTFDHKLARLTRRPGDLTAVRRNVLAIAQSTLKTVAILPLPPGSDVAPERQAFDRFADAWGRSAADVGDAGLVAAAGQSGIRDILSDDVDLATCEGVRLFTANKKAADAARRAGRLAT